MPTMKQDKKYKRLEEDNMFFDMKWFAFENLFGFYRVFANICT